jgi:hypothetical protein
VIVIELPSVEQCLTRARECLSQAETAPDAMLKNEYIKLAKELMELAAMLGAEPKGELAEKRNSPARP